MPTQKTVNQQQIQLQPFTSEKQTKANDNLPNSIFVLLQFCSVEFRKRSDAGQKQLINVQKFTDMNTLRNKVSLIGRLGAQPEVVTFKSGRSMVRFSLATNESYKNKDGEWQENTQWHNITAWGKAAEAIGNLLKKGHEIVVDGRLVTNTYETKEGEKRTGTSVELNEFLLLSPREQSEAKSK